MRKILYYGVILFLCFGVVLVFYRIKDYSGKAYNVKGSEDESGAGVKQKVLIFSIDGKTSNGLKQWHLEGKAAEMIGSEIHLEDLDAIAYGDEYTVKLKSEKGIYNRAKSEVELTGNVKVTSDDGTILTTDVARWSQETREITTDSIVEIRRENMYAKGKGAMANSFEKKAILLKDVTVRLEPRTEIFSDGYLEVKFNDNMAEFFENVRVSDKDGKLFSDALTVYFDPDTRKIAKVVAKGNVKLLKGESYTLCEEAVYTDGTSSVKFIGKPRVVIDPNEIAALGVLSKGGVVN